MLKTHSASTSLTKKKQGRKDLEIKFLEFSSHTSFKGN